MGDAGLVWTQADPLTKQIDAGQDAWRAGHINDVLTLDTGGIVVGSDTGGAWLIDNNGNTTPLGDTWDCPEVTCLDARRSRPSHSRSEVLSLTRSDHGAVRQRPESQFRREDHRSRDQSTSTDVLYRRLPASRSLHPASAGRHY